MRHAGPAVAIESEMRASYLDYAMSVIVSRAIPDLRDGLKPVHRRILYAMHETGNTHDKAYRKSARPVGDVMGKYHPHGDQAIYDALVRMAQDFSMSLPLLDGQGNFGSMDGDKPAAMRYTEVRMAKPASYLLADIDKDTVDFQPNYDGKDLEPTVLPARFPNMLVNGAGGIAVGMATNIPPHNLGEVIDATLALIENPELTVADLMEYVPAPGLPDRRADPRPLRRAQGLPRGPRLGDHPRPHPHRGGPRRPHRDHRLRDPLPGEQGDDDRAHRRARPREAHRGHRPRPGRERPLRRARRRRAPPRRDARRGAEPALPLHAAADELRLQHAGAERRPPGGSSTSSASSPPSSPSARRWSPAAPPSSSARRASGRTSSAASRSPSPTSTRWSRRSAPRPTRPRRASG